MLKWNLWIWEKPAWRVLASYETRDDAYLAGRNSGDHPDTWTVAEMGTFEDEWMREHWRQRNAPMTRIY